MKMEQIKNAVKHNIRQYAMVLALVFIVVLFQILTEGVLLRPLNITNLIQQNSYVLILSVGMLLCILTGNVDLSVGSIVAFVGAVSATFIVSWGMPTIPAIVLSLLIGGLIGAWQGFWIAYVRIPAFIVTLAGMLIFRGLTMVILKGRTLAPFTDTYTTMSSGFFPDYLGGAGGLHSFTLAVGGLCCLAYLAGELYNRKNMRKFGFETLSVRLFAAKAGAIMAAIMTATYLLSSYKGMPVVLVLVGLLILLYSFITNKTVVGRHIYAFGGNEKAARLSGIKTNRIFFWVYVNMGLLSALAGIVFAGRLNAATPKAGVGFELDAIAACFIGGASSSGGIGTVAGAIIGGLIMGVLNNGMSIMGISIDWQQAIKGLVLLLAVAFDVITKSKSR
jgi:putative multiple sugar transport system permease protein